MTDELTELDALASAELVRLGEVSPRELVDAAIARIEAVNPQLNAVIHQRFDAARTEADADALPDGPLRGVPIVVKDLDGALAGAPNHQGNRLLRDLGITADHDSYLFAKLRAAGCVIVGKTNTPELGLLPTTEPQAYGATHNPWDLARSPGGSSGGSAAAVASRMVPFAHAGDGGGSIRIPASACGLFGLKPSRGRMSLGPETGEAWAGFVARHVVSRSVRDSAAVLDVLAGAMPGDPYSAPPPARAFATEVGADPGTLRIGFRTTAPAGLAETDPACVAAVEDAAALLESLGHTVEPAAPEALDEIELLVNFVTVLAVCTAYDLVKLGLVAGRDITADDVEPVTWAQAEQGRAVSGAAFLDACESLRGWTRRMAAWWEPLDPGAAAHDLLLTPTMARPPALLGEIRGDDAEGGILAATPYAAYTVPANVTGQPAMSVPLTWTAADDGAAALPVGVQLVAATNREDVLLRVASQLETARPWIGRVPPVHA
ncbi:MAG: amidase [Acidimicrobiia bacterium]